MTLPELARECLEIQDACNMRGLTRRFHEVLCELGQLPESTGSDWIHTHPITRLWMDKLCDLCGIVRELNTDDYDAVRQLGDSVETKTAEATLASP